MADGIDVLVEWVTEMSTFVKSLDANHLVGVGDEGYFRQRLALGNRLYNGSMGVDCDRLLEIRSIDFGTCHLYPDYAPNRSPGPFGAEWVRQHIAAGERANKPMLVEEYGVRADLSAGGRNATYKTWLDQIIESGGAGALVWMIAATGADGNPYPDYDYYSIYSAEETPSIPAFA